MEKLTVDLPTLYGDHHVLEVRRILLEIPGVEDVYASSAFHVVEVSYDPEKINDLEIAVKLDSAGYLGEWTIPIEIAAKQQGEEGDQAFFRHTQTYETVKRTVSFAQNVSSQGRPLWPCPGMTPPTAMDEG